MTDLIEFLRARLDEDEAVARAATAGPWSVESPICAEAVTAANGVSVVAGGRWGGEASVFESTEDAVHIARHDPARVLAEVEAKRQLVDLYADTARLTPEMPGASAVHWTLRPVLRGFAEAYATHPDFKADWEM